MRVLAKLPQRYWLERFRPLGGLSSDRLEVWLQVVAHRVGEGIEPLLLDPFPPVVVRNLPLV